MRFELGLSRRAYAIRRGCNDKSVRKAIGNEKAHGRIWAAVLPDGTIDPDLADRLWEARTDPSQRRGKEAVRAEASMQALIERDAAAAAVEPEPDPDAGDSDEDEPAPRPPRMRAEDFENGPPRLSRDEMDAAEALAAHVAANRGRAAAGQPRPSEGSGLSVEEAEELLRLAVEEKREKVRKLRLANDEKEKGLIPKGPAENHVFAFIRAISEAWELWPDTAGPDLAARYDLESRTVIQDLRDAVRAQLTRMSGPEDLRLNG